MQNYFVATYKDCGSYTGRTLHAFNVTCFTEQLTELFLTTPQNISEKDLERQLKEGQRRKPQIALTSKKQIQQGEKKTVSLNNNKYCEHFFHSSHLKARRENYYAFFLDEKINTPIQILMYLKFFFANLAIQKLSSMEFYFIWCSSVSKKSWRIF